MTALALKFTAPGRIPSYQGGEPLPRRRWLPEAPNPVPCERGWHACRWEDTPHHIAAELWVVKVDGTIVHGNDKIAASKMLLVEQVTAWDDRTARLFAADCAERVLPIFEREYPNDDRPRLAIQAARDYANGLISATALAHSAARAAAWVARDAARDAAGAAAWAAWVARDAARDAAGAAWAAWVARDAAGAAWAAWVARDAAGAAERRWQADHLGQMCGLDPAKFMHREALR